MIDEHRRELLKRGEPLPSQLRQPGLEIAKHRTFVPIRPQPLEALLEEVGLEDTPVEGEERVQLLPLAHVEMHPATQEQPPLALDHPPCDAALAEELRAPHPGDRGVRMLHHVELVVDNATPWGPGLDAHRERAPHIHARGLNPRALAARQLAPKEGVEGGLCPIRAKPHRLSRVEVAHYGQEFHPLAEIDLIDAHLLERRAPPVSCPPLQIPRADRAPRPRSEPELATRLACSGRFAGQADGVLKPFAEWGFAGQLRDPLDAHATVGTAHSTHLHMHRRPIFPPRQIAHLALADVVDVPHAAATARTDQGASPTLAPDPQPQTLAALIDLMSIDAISRPPQNLRKVAIPHRGQCSQQPSSRKTPSPQCPLRIPAQNRFFYRSHRGGCRRRQREHARAYS